MRTYVLATVLFAASCSDDVSSGSDAGGEDASASRDAAGQDDLPTDAGARVSDAGGGAEDGGMADSDAGVPADEFTFFPRAAWMYQDIRNAPVRSDSTATIDWLEANGGWGLGRMQIDFSIEVLPADGQAPRPFTPTNDHFSPDCDTNLVPVPATGALEGESGYACTSDGDCHLIVVDRPAQRLFEMWRANITGDTFLGGCLAVWDMARVYPPEGRGEQCTSADAAGFPIAPLLFYPEEVARGRIEHAIRFILPNARMQAGVYVRPASHAGGPRAEAPAPIYGSRWRLKSTFDLSTLPNDAARTVARAMQTYGMVLADGGNVALTAASDQFRATKWAGLLGSRDLDEIQPGDFEVIDTGEAITLTFDCVRTPD